MSCGAWCSMNAYYRARFQARCTWLKRLLPLYTRRRHPYLQESIYTKNNKSDKQKGRIIAHQKADDVPKPSRQKAAVTRIRTGVAAATTQSTNHYTITASHHSRDACSRITMNAYYRARFQARCTWLKRLLPLYTRRRHPYLQESIYTKNKKSDKQKGRIIAHQKADDVPKPSRQKAAVTRIRTGVAAATTQSTNHYTITASHHSRDACSRITMNAYYRARFQARCTWLKRLLPLYTRRRHPYLQESIYTKNKKSDKQKGRIIAHQKADDVPKQSRQKAAVTRIRTGVAAATTQSTNHYTITASHHSRDACSRITMNAYYRARFQARCTWLKRLLPLYTRRRHPYLQESIYTKNNKPDKQKGRIIAHQKADDVPKPSRQKAAVTRIRTGVAAATTQSTNHYTITASHHSRDACSRITMNAYYRARFQARCTWLKRLLPLYTRRRHPYLQESIYTKNNKPDKQKGRIIAHQKADDVPKPSRQKAAVTRIRTGVAAATTQSTNHYTITASHHSRDACSRITMNAYYRARFQARCTWLKRLLPLYTRRRHPYLQESIYTKNNKSDKQKGRIIAHQKADDVPKPSRQKAAVTRIRTGVAAATTQSTNHYTITASHHSRDACSRITMNAYYRARFQARCTWLKRLLPLYTRRRHPYLQESIYTKNNKPDKQKGRIIAHQKADDVPKPSRQKAAVTRIRTGVAAATTQSTNHYTITASHHSRDACSRITMNAYYRARFQARCTWLKRLLPLYTRRRHPYLQESIYTKNNKSDKQKGRIIAHQKADDVPKPSRQKAAVTRIRTGVAAATTQSTNHYTITASHHSRDACSRITMNAYYRARFQARCTWLKRLLPLYTRRRHPYLQESIYTKNNKSDKQKGRIIAHQKADDVPKPSRQKAAVTRIRTGVAAATTQSTNHYTITASHHSRDACSRITMNAYYRVRFQARCTWLKRLLPLYTRRRHPYLQESIYTKNNKPDKQKGRIIAHQKADDVPKPSRQKAAVTRIRTGVAAATTQSTNHYTITASHHSREARSRITMNAYYRARFQARCTWLKRLLPLYTRRRHPYLQESIYTKNNKSDKQKGRIIAHQKADDVPKPSRQKAAVTRIRTGVAAATTQSTNHYTITASHHSRDACSRITMNAYYRARFQARCTWLKRLLPLYTRRRHPYLQESIYTKNNKSDKQKGRIIAHQKADDVPKPSRQKAAVTRIRTGVAAATTQSTNHYTITASHHSRDACSRITMNAYYRARFQARCTWLKRLLPLYTRRRHPYLQESIYTKNNKPDKQKGRIIAHQKADDVPKPSRQKAAVTRIRTGIAAATTQSTNHYTITASHHSRDACSRITMNAYYRARFQARCTWLKRLLPLYTRRRHPYLQESIYTKNNKPDKQKGRIIAHQKADDVPKPSRQKAAVTRIRTRVAAATTQSTNHYTITASHHSRDACSRITMNAYYRARFQARCTWLKRLLPLYTRRRHPYLQESIYTKNNKPDKQKGRIIAHQKADDVPKPSRQKAAVTRIRTGVAAATTQSTNHYTITASHHSRDACSRITCTSL
ncbi:hypothetical protein AOLI_G00200070 [Acnodon oligacanthus]